MLGDDANELLKSPEAEKQFEGLCWIRYSLWVVVLKGSRPNTFLVDWQWPLTDSILKGKTAEELLASFLWIMVKKVGRGE